MYVGGFEEVTTGGVTKYRHHLMADGREVAEVDLSNSGSTVTEAINYVFSDHLGSVDVVMDSTGNHSMSFGAFGNRREPGTWLPPVGATETQTDHTLTRYGFTHQEMLDNVALVHMNGRVYDPNLGRFLSVDPVFEFPTNTQSLNPYSYVLNNPLSMTDPTGYVSACPSGTTTCPTEGSSQGYGQDSGESSRISEGKQEAAGTKLDNLSRITGFKFDNNTRIVGFNDAEIAATSAGSGSTNKQDISEGSTASKQSGSGETGTPNRNQITPEKPVSFPIFFAGWMLNGGSDPYQELPDSAGINPTPLPGTALILGAFKGVTLLGILGKTLMEDAGKAAVEDAGQAIVKDAGGNIRVIGRWVDTQAAKNWPGHEILNIRNFTVQKNMQWIDEGIANKQIFYMASPTEGNLIQTEGPYAGEVTNYAREVFRILNSGAGYQKVGDNLVPP